MTTRPLMLLHGALQSSHQFDEWWSWLDQFESHRLDFEGHGQAPSQGRPLRAEHFVENVLAYMDKAKLTQADFFGYSLGGYVASMLAHEHPERVGRVITLGTKFLWDEATAQQAAKMMDVEIIKAKVPRFAESLAQIHTATAWETVVQQSAEMLFANAAVGGLSVAYMAEIAVPIRIMIGDRDDIADLRESYQLYQALQQGEFAVLPNTPHPFQKVDLGYLTQAVDTFFSQE